MKYYYLFLFLRETARSQIFIEKIKIFNKKRTTQIKG
jgi:hypothetical protein